MSFFGKSDKYPSVYLDAYHSYEAITELQLTFPSGEWRTDSNGFVFQENEESPPLCRLELAPTIISPDLSAVNCWEYLAELVLPNYFIILMQAGIAAIGFAEEGTIESHKVIRKYMVRAKQGKSQLKHLKTKGKSRAGSRIRLAQTKLFFEEINEKLQEWQDILTAEQVFYSASIELWNGLFEAKNQPPFTKDDKQLYNLPFYVDSPDYETLKAINIRISHNLFYIAPSIEEFFLS